MIATTHFMLAALLTLLTFSDDNGDPNKTLSRAIAEAQSEQRQLLLYFTSENCGSCVSIEEYLKRDDVQLALSQRFVTATVDIDDFDGKACKEIYKVGGVPSLVVVKPDGSVTFRKNGDAKIDDIKPIVKTGEVPSMEKKSTTSLEATTVPKVKAKSKPTVTRQTTPVEKTAPAVIGEDKIALQVGFFSSKANAEKMRARVEQQGFEDTSVREERRNDKTFYRVLVGSYSDTAYADTDMQALKDSGFSVKLHKESR